MSLIKIEGVQSLSAPTKAQKDAALYMFGSKGHSIVAVLDKFSRVKELRTAHIDGLLKLMKEGEDDDIIKFTSSAAGKKSIAAAKQFAVAKTFAASIKALKLVRVPMKWIDGHSDAAAARIAETKEIRARKTAGNRPEKPIKLDNPHAPEATTAYTPSGKSPITLVDELAEVTARKISAKPLQAREEYFNALRTVLQNNLPKREVSATSTGVVVSGGSKMYTLRLDDNAWTLQTGVTGKTKKVGVTFDIVDLLAMIDKGILRPKPEATGSRTAAGPSKSPLADELANTSAREISAKSLDERRSYITALASVIRKNFPSKQVEIGTNKIVVSGVGGKYQTLSLKNNAWYIQSGVDKAVKIGTTLPMSDMSGLIDVGSSSPKPKGGSASSRKQPPYFDRVTKDAKTGEYRTIIQANENQAFQVSVKREGDKFVFTSPVYPDVQRFVTQGMTEADVMWETFTGKSVTFSKEDADKFEKWIKSIKRTTALTSNYLFPAIAPTRSGGGMSM